MGNRNRSRKSSLIHTCNFHMVIFKLFINAHGMKTFLYVFLFNLLDIVLKEEKGKFKQNLATSYRKLTLTFSTNLSTYVKGVSNVNRIQCTRFFSFLTSFAKKIFLVFSISKEKYFFGEWTCFQKSSGMQLMNK